MHDQTLLAVKKFRKYCSPYCIVNVFRLQNYEHDFHLVPVPVLARPISRLCSNLNCIIYLLWDFLWEGVLVRLVGPKLFLTTVIKKLDLLYIGKMNWVSPDYIDYYMQGSGKSDKYGFIFVACLSEFQ